MEGRMNGQGWNGMDGMEWMNGTCCWMEGEWKEWMGFTQAAFTQNIIWGELPFDLFAMPVKDTIRLHASSGTTGKPTVVGYSRKDIDTFSEVVARSLVASGCQPGMKLQNAYGYSPIYRQYGHALWRRAAGHDRHPRFRRYDRAAVLFMRDFR